MGAFLNPCRLSHNLEWDLSHLIAAVCNNGSWIAVELEVQVAIRIWLFCVSTLYSTPM